MYKINEENVQTLRGMKNEYYATRLDITPQYLSGIFNGAKCSGILARSILSVFFNISLNDSRIDEYLKKYFIRTQEE